MSGPRRRVDTLVSLLRHPLGEPEQGDGRFFLPHGKRWGNIAGVYYDPSSDGSEHCVLELTATALEAFDGDTKVSLAYLRERGYTGSMPRGALAILAACMSIGMRATRLDIAIDFVGEWDGLIDQVHGACERGELTGCRTYGLDRRHSAGEVVGEMVMLGRRGSEGSGRYVRVYDKGLETGTAQRGYWVRWEAELADDCALDAALRITAADLWEDSARGLAMGCVDFRQVTGRKHLSGREARPRSAWYTTLLGGVETQQVKAFRVASTLQGWARWIESSVWGQVQSFAEAKGMSVGDFLALIAQRGQPDPRHLRTSVGRELCAIELDELVKGFSRGWLAAAEVEPPVQSRRSAFTLIELLLVIVIVASLVAMMIVGLSGLTAESRRIKCMANERTIGLLTADHIGAIKQHRRFPTWDEMDLLDSPVLRCPSDRRDGYIPSSYIRQPNGFVSGPLNPLAHIDYTPWYRIPVVFDFAAWHLDGSVRVKNVGMLDGSVESWQ